MQGRMIVQFSKITLPIMLLSFHVMSYGVIAYIPQGLRDCINIVHAAAEKTRNINNLEELHAMVMKENRILACDDMVRKAIKEALSVVRNNKKMFQDQAVEKYLQAYVSSLQDTSVLLSMHSDKAQLASWPVSLVSRSIDSLVARDMICLSNELACQHNISLCGNSDIAYNKFSQVKDSNSDLNKHGFTDCALHLPTIMFGTGVASPIVNAWQMLPSYWEQFPIMMKFPMDGYLNPKKNVMLELHFLVQQHAAPDGMARVRVDGIFMDSDGNTYEDVICIVDSNDFLVTQQVGSTNALSHISVRVKLEKAMFKPYNSALLAVKRIAPTTGVEYEANLYLTAAVLRYSV